MEITLYGILKKWMERKYEKILEGLEKGKRKIFEKGKLRKEILSRLYFMKNGNFFILWELIQFYHIWVIIGVL